MTDTINLGAACPKCSRLVGHAPDCPIDYSRVELPDDYEKPVVPLVGEDGGAFQIIGRVRSAIRRAGAPKEYVDVVFLAMTAGDYGHMLRVAMDVTETPEFLDD